MRCAETQTGPKNLGEELPEPLYMGSPLLLSDPSSLCAGLFNAVERVAKVVPKKIQHHIVTKLNSEAPVYLMDLHMSYMSSNRRDLRVSSDKQPRRPYHRSGQTSASFAR